MREIKFRVWNLVDKKWEGPYDDCVWVVTQTGQIGSFSQSDYYKSICIEKNVIFRQYTGFKDKNGVEICEGDILINNFGLRHPVIYGNGCFWVNISPLYEHIDNPSLEIIGNIDENPELKIDCNSQ